MLKTRLIKEKYIMKKFNLFNNKINIVDYGLKDEDIYNIAKYGQEHVARNVRWSAADLLTNILENCNNKISSHEDEFFIIMLSDLFDDKNKVFEPARKDLVRTIDDIIKTNGNFSLKLWIKAEKQADEFLKQKNSNNKPQNGNNKPTNSVKNVENTPKRKHVITDEKPLEDAPSYVKRNKNIRRKFKNQLNGLISYIENVWTYPNVELNVDVQTKNKDREYVESLTNSMIASIKQIRNRLANSNGLVFCLTGCNRTDLTFNRQCLVDCCNDVLERLPYAENCVMVGFLLKDFLNDLDSCLVVSAENLVKGDYTIKAAKVYE